MLLARAILGDAVSYGEVRDDRFHLMRGDVFGEHGSTGNRSPLTR